MAFEFDDSGLKKLKKNLVNISNLEHGKNIPIEDLFTIEFMKRYTKSRNFKEFLAESGFIDPEELVTKEVFEAFPNEEWNEYISKNTFFSSWNDMLRKSTEEYIKSNLFKGMK
jgi:hypothetical protein